MTPESLEGTLWQGVLSRIRERISDQQYETWFRGVQPGACSDEVLELSVPNSFSREWLRKKYADVILGAVEGMNGGRRPTLRIVVRGGTAAGGPAPGVPDDRMTAGGSTIGSAPAAAEGPADPPAFPTFHEVSPRPRPGPQPMARAALSLGGAALNRDYRLSAFISGPGNRLAVAAAQAVVEKETPVYNPLFIHGGVGLGKTHLLQAIGHALQERRPGMKVRYVPCEHFTNQYIAAVERGEIETFRSIYREVDALIVDDAHFLAQKERTQEEFFHTFNALHNRQRQIVLAADAPPGEIPGLSERLVSRFKSGLVCELDSPDFATRLEILRRKGARTGQDVPDDVTAYIAEHVRTNVRELEGALTRVTGHACLAGVPLTLQMARETLRDVVVERRRKVTIDHIAKAVTTHYGARLAELQSKTRTHVVAVPRQVCMFLARKLTGHSLEEIGGYFGGRDHSTVLYGIEKTESRARDDGEFRALVETLGAQALQIAAS